MKSPFAIFRKHQKVLMVVLTGLAMFAFVVMDSVRADSSGATLPILCGVAGMAIFGFFGWRRGEAVTFGAVGIAVGVVVGVFLMLHSGSGPKAPVETDAGNLTHTDLNNLVTRRNNANQFIRLAFEKVVPYRENNPMFAQMLEQEINQRMFGFGRERDDVTEDVLLGYLLDKEADEMGIVVSEQTVSDYINRVTNKKLTPKDFASVLKTLHLSESEVFESVRGELRAKLALEMLLPRAVPSPEQYWEEYRKLGVTETLDVAAVPVADFLSAAPQPTEDQLLTYFDSWKEIPPAYPGGPGLRQPRRVRIEYLQAAFAETEKEVAKKPITDQEIKKYYEDHREEYRAHPQRARRRNLLRSLPARRSRSPQRQKAPPVKKAARTQRGERVLRTSPRLPLAVNLRSKNRILSRKKRPKRAASPAPSTAAGRRDRDSPKASSWP